MLKTIMCLLIWKIDKENSADKRTTGGFEEVQKWTTGLGLGESYAVAEGRAFDERGRVRRIDEPRDDPSETMPSSLSAKVFLVTESMSMSMLLTLAARRISMVNQCSKNDSEHKEKQARSRKRFKNVCWLDGLQ